MKKTLILFSLFLTFFAYAQSAESCKLKLTNEFVNSSSYGSFKAITKKNALKKPFNFIKVNFIKNPAIYNDIVDSIELKIKEVAFGKVPDSIWGNYKIRDSIERIEYSKKYGDIPKPLIIKTGQLDDIIGIIYHSQSHFSDKYYLRISKDNGRTWKNYFTGLIKNNKYIFKSNSKYNLWKDKNSIQIEADIVRMTEPLVFPGGGPVYETIKNNALLILDIDEITKDSDQDGLNDLEEKMEYFTNPYSKDSDQDGINDLEDHNPKYKTRDNDFTKLLEGIIYGNYEFLENPDPMVEEFEINLKTFDNDISKQLEELKNYSSKREKSFVDSLGFKVIITNDENLRGIKTYGERVIFLNSKEFAAYNRLQFMNQYRISYSTVFKCEELPDTYILIFDGIITGNTYIIRKTTDGWKVKIYDRWMT